MQFISWGDFTIPFDWATYWAKHFYSWSFQSGTPNPDGLIRLPGRLLNFIVFGASGNVGVGYFYIFSSLVIAFVAFFFFARKFLQVKRTSVQVIGALFFALNPVFLGNLAKVGLVLAVAMLPLCLLAIRAAFIQKRFRYLLLYIICINLSFLHPYTFTVNLAISGAYFAWMAWQNRAWVRDTWLKFVVVGLFALAINLYFVLPLASLGTVSKDVISSNITPSPTDYTALVGVSNTGDLFTGFSLSKNVFVDFSFYNPTYQNIYFFGVFLFYVILFGLYLYTEKRLNLSDKRRLGVFFGGFLVLLLLAATKVAHIDSLIKFLIAMPGGWAFRSPLKWQLYIPLVLFGILVILLNRVPGKLRLFAFEAGLLATFLIMNAYLSADIYFKILTPRAPAYFASLAKTNFDGKSVLFINNGECMEFMRTYPVVTTEMNQIFGSKNVQLKHVLEDSVDSVNLSDYDYVLGCEDRIGDLLADKFDFKQTASFVNGTFRLYDNQKPVPAVATTDTLYRLSSPGLIGSKYRFATKNLSEGFGFLPDSSHPATTLVDAFENLTPSDIHDGSISSKIPLSQQLQLRAGDTVYYKSEGTRLTLSPNPRRDLQPVQSSALNTENASEIDYEDPKIHPQNLVPNSSFEQGLWQGVVGDCYAYDNKPIIGMRLSTTDKTSGSQALELSARSHIACTGPAESITVSGDSHYLLSFDYQSPGGGKYAGYYVGFDDPDETVVSERMQNQTGGWQKFSKDLVVPKGATSMRLLLYAFPDSYSESDRIARYDQVSLTPIPGIQDRFYLTDSPKTNLAKPYGLAFETKNPTRKIVQVKGAGKPFYLTTNESYHDKWQAEVIGRRPKVALPFTARNKVADEDHLRLDGTLNAWYIDPAKLCGQGNGCTRNADGSYDFTMAIEFVPQRWFYFGASISAATLASGIAYYLYDRRQGEKHKEGRWRWHR